MLLGVNIDHIATLRNARGGIEPDVLTAARICKECGAASITTHLREDRRHIKDADVEAIRMLPRTRLNLEMAMTDEMQEIALRIRPHAICLVPEKRQELTTEGGLDVEGQLDRAIEFVKPLLAKNIENEETTHLGVMDITVKTNAYGTQLDSFTTNTIIKEISKSPIELVFVRAPYITDVNPNISIIATLDNNIVAVRQDNILATSFHPELTNDTSFLNYFINNIVT